MRATGWSPSEIQTRIIKHMYPDRGRPTKWAKLAYDRGWITLAAYLRVPLERGPSFMDLMYEKNPLFSLFKMGRQ